MDARLRTSGMTKPQICVTSGRLKRGASPIFSHKIFPSQLTWHSQASNSSILSRACKAWAFLCNVFDSTLPPLSTREITAGLVEAVRPIVSGWAHAFPWVLPSSLPAVTRLIPFLVIKCSCHARMLLSGIHIILWIPAKYMREWRYSVFINIRALNTYLL